MCRHGGSTSFKRESRLAECWRDLHTAARPSASRPNGTRSAAGSIWGWTGPAAPLAEAYSDCYRNPIDNHGIAAMINSEMTSAPM
jgi:hypothetical protein